MTREDQLELKRAAKVQGLEDEIALVRMRLKKAVVEEGEDLELLSLGLDRLSRAIGIQHKMHPKPSEETWESFEAALHGVGRQLFPEDYEKRGGPPKSRE